MHKNPTLFIKNKRTLPQSHQPSHITEHTHSSSDNQCKLLKTTTIPPTITHY